MPSPRLAGQGAEQTLPESTDRPHGRLHWVSHTSIAHFMWESNMNMRRGPGRVQRRLGSRAASSFANDARSTLCRVPRPLWARTPSRSTVNPAVRSRRSKAGSSLADQKASTPPGASAARSAATPRRSYSRALADQRQRRGTVVHVEQNRLEAGDARPNDRRHVPVLDAYARVVERTAGERSERAAVPLDDRRDQFGDDDGGRRAAGSRARRAG